MASQTLLNATTLLFLFLGLISFTIAQPNIVYPPLGKRWTPKKGQGVTVTHTFPDYFGLDTLPFLAPYQNDFPLVDRHYASLLVDQNDRCKATSVLVSMDNDDVDLGRFGRKAWAEQAIKLRRGLVHVNYDVIAANVDSMNEQNKKMTPKFGSSKRKHESMNNSTITRATFLMYFKCPPATDAFSKNKTFALKSSRTEFSVAMRYQSVGTLSTSSSYSQAFLEIATSITGLEFTNPDGFWQDSVVIDPSDPLVIEPNRGRQLVVSSTAVENIHRPVCDTVKALGPENYCKALYGVQNILFYIAPSPLFKAYDCKITYPAEVQPNIDESQNLATDKLGNKLPAAFVDLVDPINGLPLVVDPAIVAQEKATMYWLIDKVNQLYNYAPCAGAGVSFALQGQFAPDFGPSKIHYLKEFNEIRLLPSNFTDSPFAYSAVGTDGAGSKTTIVAIRGTQSRSEWMINSRSDLMLVTANSDPVLGPFIGLEIHAGYAETFVQIYPAIKSNVTSDDPVRIIVTGHSLGAGMATLVSYALAKDFGGKKVDAALFAPPSVGNKAFAYDFNRRVNARRAAFTAYRPTGEIAFSRGDQVPQVPCPDDYLCFLGPGYVSTKGPFSLQTTQHYKEVAGNVLFQWRNMPAPPPSYGLPSNIVQQSYKKFDVKRVDTVTHGCSYTCYFSDAVNANLTKCLFKEDVKEYPGKIPLNVQQYGLCRGPPPNLPGNVIATPNAPWFGPEE